MEYKEFFGKSQKKKINATAKFNEATD